jgi:hypothetical protein
MIIKKYSYPECQYGLTVTHDRGDFCIKIKAEHEGFYDGNVLESISISMESLEKIYKFANSVLKKIKRRSKKC